LKANFSDDVTFGISGTFSYTNDVERSLDLPTIKLNSSIDFNITQNGLQVPLLFIWERKDFKVNSDIIYCCS
jgi:hypothetical protein